MLGGKDCRKESKESGLTWSTERRVLVIARLQKMRIWLTMLTSWR